MDTSTTRKIVSISFFYSGERVRINVDSKGKFPLPKVRPSGTTRMHSHTALEFVSHEKVRVLDPVLTLSDGMKMRVYLGGDPTYMVVEAASIIENHDKENASRSYTSRKKKTPIKKPAKRTTGKMSFLKDDSDYDDYDYYYDLGFPHLNNSKNDKD